MHTLKRCMAAMVALLALSLAMTARAELPDFTPLVEQASPAVVNISTRQKLPDRAMARGQLSIPDLEGLPPMFRDFLERSIPQVPRNPRGQQREAQSLGSGFIISNDGYILTNNHVVADADEILVRLSDRSEHKAKLIGADPRSDVAVLKIEAKNLPTLKLGDSNKLKVGEWVLAIGSPFGFDHSVTAGIVSAKGRSLPNESYVPFIQTDVAINPGNSGGPLLNLEGEVVGINSQIFTRSGGFMGLSFAIPIDVALNVADQLKKAGKVSRGWLGVVILSLNGQSINESADLPHLVGNMKPGDKINLDVIRNGQRKSLSMAVGSLPDDDEEIASMGAPGAERSSNRLGVTVADLTAEQRKSLDIQGGVVIKEVQDGPAAVIGLRPGDVITHLDNKAVTSTKIFADVAKALPKNRSVSMRVLRQGRASFITFKLAE
ncbi:DegQ family serine endoprotease [Pseudomonas aeruginosa]